MSKNNQINLTRRRAMEMLAIGAASPLAALAADPFPSRPIRLILPFSAGSSTDFISRLVADKVAAQVGQGVIVENKAGAGGVIGTQQIARSAPDGHTIGLVSTATLAMVPPTLKDAPYDSVRDFAPLTVMITTDLFLVVGASARGNTVSEFVSWAKSQSNPLFLGTLGAGTSGHFAGFLFGQAAKMKFEPIHYKNFAELMPAMMSGDVHAALLSPSQILPFVKAGSVRALAMNGPSRLSAFPDTPTFTESGYPDMQFSNWIGLVAPAKTPVEVLDRLHAEITKAVRDPQVGRKLEESGYRLVANKREEFAETIRKDAILWRDMVKNTGFKV